MDEWIRVGDKMPYHREVVIVLYHGKPRSAYLNTNSTWINLDSGEPFLDQKGITCWRPLPEPHRLETNNEWIRVETQCPTTGQEIYFFHPAYGVLEGTYGLEEREGEGYFFCRLGMVRGVTHWMPKQYPKPPKPDGPFRVRIVNSVPIVTYQPECCIPKPVGYTAITKEEAREIVDNLNEIWNDRS